MAPNNSSPSPKSKQGRYVLSPKKVRSFLDDAVIDPTLSSPPPSQPSPSDGHQDQQSSLKLGKTAKSHVEGAGALQKMTQDQAVLQVKGQKVCAGNLKGSDAKTNAGENMAAVPRTGAGLSNHKRSKSRAPSKIAPVPKASTSTTASSKATAPLKSSTPGNVTASPSSGAGKLPIAANPAGLESSSTWNKNLDPSTLPPNSKKRRLNITDEGNSATSATSISIASNAPSENTKNDNNNPTPHPQPRLNIQPDEPLHPEFRKSLAQMYSALSQTVYATITQTLQASLPPLLTQTLQQPLNSFIGAQIHHSISASLAPTLRDSVLGLVTGQMHASILEMQRKGAVVLRDTIVGTVPPAVATAIAGIVEEKVQRAMAGMGAKVSDCVRQALKDGIRDEIPVSLVHDLPALSQLSQLVGRANYIMRGEMQPLLKACCAELKAAVEDEVRTMGLLHNDMSATVRDVRGALGAFDKGGAAAWAEKEADREAQREHLARDVRHLENIVYDQSADLVSEVRRLRAEFETLRDIVLSSLNHGRQTDSPQGSSAEEKLIVCLPALWPMATRQDFDGFYAFCQRAVDARTGGVLVDRGNLARMQWAMARLAPGRVKDAMEKWMEQNVSKTAWAGVLGAAVDARGAQGGHEKTLVEWFAELWRVVKRNGSGEE